jgi:hypothetical protein
MIIGSLLTGILRKPQRLRKLPGIIIPALDGFIFTVRFLVTPTFGIFRRQFARETSRIAGHEPEKQKA